MQVLPFWAFPSQFNSSERSGKETKEGSRNTSDGPETSGEHTVKLFQEGGMATICKLTEKGTLEVHLHLLTQKSHEAQNK